VHGKVPVWRGILGECGDGAALQVVPVRRTENEDALRFAKIQAAVCPSRAVARVIVASVPGQAGRRSGHMDLSIEMGRLEANGTHGAITMRASAIGTGEPSTVSG